ncbi:hypothetical protein HY572_01880 [Candidatus Micrarchaeota archaeon]|nr:hypothetical protein [Candidatus Micrarchaeota archaeon]
MLASRVSSFSASKSEIKDLVILVLSREEHLSAKQVFQTIKKDFGSPATYQGVHKALRVLTGQGVLIEDKRKYVLDQKWITDLNSFVNKMEAKRSGRAALEFGEIKNASSVTLSFDSYMEALYALLDNMDRDYSENKEPDTTVAHWYHAWPVTCVSKKEFEQLRRMMSLGEHYAVINQQTALDSVLADFWKDLGKKVHIGVSCATSCDLLVTRDKVVQLFLSPPVRKGINSVFKKSDEGQIDFAALYSFVYGLKGNVSLIITSNPELADEIRGETLKYFK